MSEKKSQMKLGCPAGHLSFLMTVLLTWLVAFNISAQQIKLEESRFTPMQTFMSVEKIKGRKAVRVVKLPDVLETDAPTFVKINDLVFKDGVIEAMVLSRLLPDAPAYARGFIGLAFRINSDNSMFECIDIRPANSIAGDQLRRNRTVQYFAYPDFKYDRSRATAPGQYESYADIAPEQWIKLKMEIRRARAKLFINGAKQPSLIVNDLKLGPEQSGSIGLWTDVGLSVFFGI